MSMRHFFVQNTPYVWRIQNFSLFLKIHKFVEKQRKISRNDKLCSELSHFLKSVSDAFQNYLQKRSNRLQDSYSEQGW